MDSWNECPVECKSIVPSPKGINRLIVLYFRLSVCPIVMGKVGGIKDNTIKLVLFCPGCEGMVQVSNKKSCRCFYLVEPGIVSGNVYFFRRNICGKNTAATEFFCYAYGKDATPCPQF